MMGMGAQELLLILLVVLVLFGAKRLPELARGLGQGVQQFRKAMNEAHREIEGNDPREAGNFHGDQRRDHS